MPVSHNQYSADILLVAAPRRSYAEPLRHAGIGPQAKTWYRKYSFAALDNIAPKLF